MSNKAIPVGLEMYSVRNTLAKDLVGTLEAVKSYGYDAVEFAGGHKYDAKTTADALKATGLYVSSWHVSYDALLTSEEKFKATVEYHQTVGNKYLMIPGVPAEWLASYEAIKATADKFNALSEKLAAFGMYTGYHNHNTEFKPLPDKPELTAWSAVRELTNDNFVMQMDTGNALSGNADVNGEIAKAAGRSQIVHLKPYSLKNGYATLIGADDDDIDYNFILPFCKEKGNTHIYVIEYECEQLYSDMEGVKLCLEGLKNKFGGLL